MLQQVLLANLGNQLGVNHCANIINKGTVSTFKLYTMK